MNMLIRRIQLRNRILDLLDRRKGINWYAPIGTYDGVESGRPPRRILCHYCGGAHSAGTRH